ncbi:MAG: Bro-N domain-containing protein [Patescibacteria group bacterium]
MKNEKENLGEGRLAIFQGKEVRRVIYKNEWWFSVVDVCGALTESPTPRQYWEKIKTREFTNFQLSPNWGQLKLLSSDGKSRETDCANTEGIFRIIQSIPSPKAEPFKRWLAKVGYERVKEIEDPELATKRTRTLYKLKGYDEAWIEKRLRGINIREELTDEWQKREIKSQREFAILTAEISKATFDMTPSEYKKFKGLDRENLRDHMDGLELIFSMLGEAATTKIAQVKDAQGFIENQAIAKVGGKIAGDARRKLELAAGEKVSTKENYLTKPQNKKLLK